MPTANKRLRRSSANNPLAVIIPPARCNIESRIAALKKERKRFVDNPQSMTSGKVRACYVNLVDAMFSHLGVDRGSYSKCFGICVTFCKTTNVYKASSWDSWDGLQEFMRMTGKADRLTRHSNLLHCPAAKYLIAVMALELVVLQGKTSGRNKVSGFMTDFDCYNKVVSAICHCQNGDGRDTLTLDQPWDLTVRVQCSPNRLMTLFEFATFENGAPASRSTAAKKATQSNKKSDLIKIESSPEYEAEPAAVHQPVPHAVQQPGLPPPPTVPTASYGIQQFGRNSLHQTSSPAMDQIVSHALPQAGPPGMNQFIASFDRQNTPVFVRQTADSRETRLGGQMPPSMPWREPNTHNETTMQVAREDVMECLQPLFARLKHEDWTGSVYHDLMRILTEQNIKVITAEAKGMLGLWAGRTNNGAVLSWLDRAQEDRCVFQWIERIERHGHHVHAILYDINATIAAVLEPTVRDQLRAQVAALKEAILPIVADQTRG
ncbi:hypothetical protein ACQKWADRAFT_306912 [Trichoderma austrokoningii]